MGEEVNRILEAHMPNILDKFLERLSAQAMDCTVPTTPTVPKDSWSNPYRTCNSPINIHLNSNPQEVNSLSQSERYYTHVSPFNDNSHLGLGEVVQIDNTGPILDDNAEPLSPVLLFS